MPAHLYPVEPHHDAQAHDDPQRLLSHKRNGAAQQAHLIAGGWGWGGRVRVSGEGGMRGGWEGRGVEEEC